MGDNELWQAFLFEVTEQLDHLEKSLIHLQKHPGAAAPDTINQIFRYFHSIKSSCAMFEFAGMEAIAHAAESVLDDIRKGITPLTGEMTSLLLKAVDGLKEQLAEADANQKPPQHRPDLLEMLLSHVASKEQKSAHVIEEKTNDLGIDVEMMEEFASLSLDCLQQFFSALGSDEQEQADKALKKWEKACTALEFTRLSAYIGHLRQLLASDSVKDTAAALTIFSQLIDQIKGLEELTGQVFDLSEIYPFLENLYVDHYQQLLQQLSQQLQLCAGAGAGQGVDAKALDELCEQVDELLILFKLFGFAGSCDLLRYFNQLCRKAILGQLTLEAEIFALLQEVIVIHAEALGNYEQQLRVDVQCHEIVGMMRQQLINSSEADFNRTQRLSALMAKLDIPAGYLDYVDNGSIELLEYGLGVGKTIALVLADLEADHDWANAFTHWLNSAEIITSRTVFCKKVTHGQSVDYTKISFLLMFDISEEEVRRSLAGIEGSDLYIESLIFNHGQGKSDAAPVANPAVAPSARADSPRSAVSGGGARNEVADKSIRIGSDVVDRFVVQVGEMVLRRNMLSHAIHNLEIDTLLKRSRSILDSMHDDKAHSSQLRELQESLDKLTGHFDELLAANVKLDQSVSFVQEEVMSLRVVPIGMVFNRLPRIVRNINREYGKDIHLDIVGEEVRVDKSMVDVLMEPLVHLVRNCADHGIESHETRQRLGKTAQATIKVSAEQAGNTLFIKVADNGSGLDFGKIRDKALRLGIIPANASLTEEQLKQLIFAPGFSTSETVTETSGRGVGMDAVRSSLLAIGGTIDVSSEVNIGTVFTLKVPLSAAIQGVIVFHHHGETLTVPERNVICGLSVRVRDLQTVQGQAAFVYQGDIIPVYAVGELLHWTSSASRMRGPDEEQELLIVTDDACHMALAVDKVIGRQEIFVRNLHADLMSLPGVGGASILGNGQVALILNCEELMQIASKNSQNMETLLKVS